MKTGMTSVFLLPGYMLKQAGGDASLRHISAGIILKGSIKKNITFVLDRLLYP